MIEMTRIVTTITPEEWYKFQMGHLTIVERTDETHFLKAYLVGRQDSLRQGKYDGEYINFSYEDTENTDPIEEIAEDPWGYSFNTDEIDIHGFTWAIRVDDAGI